MTNNFKPSHSFSGGDAITADHIDGQGGTLDGETVNEIYLFNPGCGQDSIDDTAVIDILRFGAGVLPADITIVRSGMDVVLNINPHSAFDTSGGSGQATDQLILKNWGGSRSACINRIEFADGTVWHAAYLQSQIPGVVGSRAGDESQTA